MPLPVLQTLKVNPKAKPRIIGLDMNNYFNEIYSFVRSTRNPNYFIGDPGTGKSHFIKQILMQLARDLECKAYLTQLDDESTRQSVIGGNTFIDGSQMPFLAVVGKAMEEGGVVGVDEVPHGMQTLQTIFNTPTDRDSRYSFGTKMLEAHPNFRILFGGNRTFHTNNNALVHSFASRLMTWPFEYPSGETEASIAKNIAAQSIGEANIRVPDGLIYYLTSWVRSVRTMTDNTLCVSARNVAMMIELFSLLAYNPHAKLPTEWTNKMGAETIRRKVAKGVFFKDVASDDDLGDEMVTEALHYIAGIGVERTRMGCMQAAMGYLNIDGVQKQTMSGWFERMWQSVI